MKHPLVLAITGASGVVYATRLLEALVRAERQVHLVISPSGGEVLRHELKIETNPNAFDPTSLLPAELAASGDLPPNAICYHRHDDFFAPIASGSFLTDAMVICPCSGGTLSAIVHGASGNLIHRAADVHLKERRKLILTPRETPLSLVQLDNMKRAAEAGAVVLPASPGWYYKVEKVGDLVDFVVARILDQLQVEHSLTPRWGAE